MEKKKVITKQDLLNEAARPSQTNKDDIEQLFTKYMGEYQPDEFSPKSNGGLEHMDKESDMDEGKLFTKFLMRK